MAALPAYVRIQVDSYNEVRDPAVRRTEMEGGLTKQAAFRSKVLVRRPVTAYIEALSDYQSWIAFVRDTLNHGADWFDWTDPVDSQSKSARLVGGLYEARPLGPIADGWLVTFELETWG